jgi:hypothetical protein
MKDDNMKATCNVHGRHEKDKYMFIITHILVRSPRGLRENLEDKNTNKRLILKWILYKYVLEKWTIFEWLSRAIYSQPFSKQ